MTGLCTLEVGHDTFTALARLSGGAEAVSVLRTGQLSKRVLLLAAVRRSAAEHAPRAARAARLEPAFELLARLQEHAPEVWERTILHPYLDAWAARCLRVLAADPPRSQPVQTAELGYLGPLAAHAAARSGLAHLVPAALRPWPADDLPSVRLDSRGIRLSLYLDDRNPLRGQYGRELAGPLAAKDIAAWRSRLTDSWELLCTDHRPLAEAMAACLTRIVPLRPGPAGPVVSSAARRAYGAVGASLPRDPEVLALTLVHEFLHVQLGALLDLVPLHQADRTPRYRAAWRPDLRPVGALLQGAYAHLGVTGFWHTRLRAARESSRRERARRQFAHQRKATADALDALANSGQLTEAGAVFVHEMRLRLEEW